jgi:hypothetical protein
LIWECVALRHQVTVLERSPTRRPCFRLIDRLFWVLLSWWWPGWREALTIIQADTVLCWRRDGIAVIWKYRSRGRRRRGRPRIAVETRQRDGPGEFSLGCTTYSRRAAETRNHSLAGYRLTLHAGLAWRTAVAEHGAHSYGTKLPRSSAIGFSKGAIGSTTSDLGRALSGNVPPHLLQPRSPGQVRERGILRMRVVS